MRYDHQFRLAKTALAVVTLAFVFSSNPLAAQGVVRGRTANPHGSLRIACENCHSTSTWKPIRAVPEFSHDTQTKYPLRGMHQGVACRNCHRNLDFKSVATQCAECHADIHHRQFGARCQDCHTVRGWQASISAVRQHNNRFPLIGAHASASCDGCHPGAATGIYNGLSTECAACHLKEYQSASAPDHKASGFSLTCTECHNMDSWANARFDHNGLTTFPLVGAHARVECAGCHIGGRFKGTPQTCFECHSANFAQARNPDHALAGFSHDCRTCHNLNDWTGASFDHTARTRFALTGVHATVTCAQCHVNGRFAGTPKDCAGCHLSDFEKTANPNHRTGKFALTCEGCHTTATWQGAKFDHNLSRFQLTGAHQSVACASCHVAGRYTGTASLCSGCHLKDFQSSKNPNHVTAGFPQDCTICHTTVQWQGARFDHALKTRFALTGAHANASCQQCHTGGQFAGTAMQCSACHLKDFQGAKNPGHVAAGFSQDCAACHTTAQWQGAKFDHSTTRFALTGAHVNVACAQCHVAGKFAGMDMTCAGCHLKDFQVSKNPNHVTAGFPQDCTLCHTTVQWQGSKYDHATKTRFALTGAHATVSCSQCHVGGQFAGTTMQCAGCHAKDFQSARNPNHVAAGFPQDCAACHTTVQWQGANFDHSAMTKFALTGAHSSVTCAQCHVGGQFKDTTTQCSGCHLKDFQGTKNPNHVAAGFPQDCALCHTTVQWQGAKFDHSATPFPLTGAHTSIACAQCHVGGQFKGTTMQCSGCHLKDFQGTRNPNHVAAGFPQDCTLCHTTVRWTGAKFDHAKTQFPLTGAHATVACAACHVGGQFKGTAQQCVGCHLKDFQGTKNPNHVAAGFPQDCAVCHTTVQWLGAKFDHAKTRFPLTGAHATTACSACHVGGQYAGTNMLCAGCHLKDFQGTKNPNHVAAGFPQDCAVCHTTVQWLGAKFDHAKTKFPLTGAHSAVACAQCHIGGQYAGTTTQCVGCHLKDFQGTKNPNHITAGFPQDCTLCHTTAQWMGAKFDHSKTPFPLTGAHTALACAQCHVNGQFAGTSMQCSACHLKDFQGTKNPNHIAAGFPQDCTLCHTTAQWMGAKFDHSKTKFPLTGAHTSVACAQCHVNGQFAGTPVQCAGCHLKDFQGTNNPNHISAGFPQDCTLCHTTTQWMGAKFDHSKTPFPLTGAHTVVACAQCHVNGRFAGTPVQCVGCHLKDFQGTNNPNHVSAGFPQDCTLCHTTAQWMGAKFDHSKTPFPLTGAHTSVACAQCHVNGRFAGTPVQCVGCHLKDFQGTNNPNHVSAGFPQDCTLCHTTAQWMGAKFDHSKTRFPLTGSHTSVACAQCHVNGQYTGTTMQCVGCHLKDFQGTTNPNHVSAGFPQDCTLCHTTAQWLGAKFDHAKTPFPLTGAHTNVPCAQCHVNNQFAGTSTDCASCHLKDFTGATSPNHVAAGFPKTCGTCHNTTQWAGATFDHTAMTKFPLTGAHTAVACATCHVNSVFAGLSTACASCHLAKYNATTNPNHVAAGFPQDCSMCHTTTNWTGATFNHATTGFPLTGAHSTQACSACHVNNVFKGTLPNCDACHIKEYQGATNPNHVSAGFPKDCSICHSTTNWTGATFDHTKNTKFPLTGAHTTVACSSCHVNNVFAGTPTDCYSCHQAQYNTVTNPNHLAAGFPKTCETCHTTAAWTGATFNHTWFPIYSGSHSGKWTTCGDCHSNSSDFSVFTCTSCHTHAQAQTDPHHTQVKGYVYNSINCYSCHPTGRAG
jgi:hypothetical protein